MTIKETRPRFGSDGELMPWWARKLYAAMIEDEFAVKRSKLRELVYEVMLHEHDLDADDIHIVYYSSPLIGDGGQQIKPPCTVAGFRDALSMRALLAIATYEMGYEAVAQAMHEPEEHGVTSIRGKTGYNLGEPKTLKPITEIMDMLERIALREAETPAESSPTKPVYVDPTDFRANKPSQVIAALGVYVRDVRGFVKGGLRPNKHSMIQNLGKLIPIVMRGDDKERQDEMRLSVSHWINESYSEEVWSAFIHKQDGVIAACVHGAIDGEGYSQSELASYLGREVAKTAGASKTTSDEVIAEIIEDVTTHKEKETMTTKTAAAKPTHLKMPADESVVKLVDMTLTAASMPSLEAMVSSINSLEDGVSVLRVERDELVNELSLAKAKAKKGMAAPALSIMRPGEVIHVEASGEMPKGSWQLKKASEVFEVDAGRDTFDFDVPFWTWEGNHPDVPKVDKDYVFRPFELFRLLASVVGNKRMYLHGDTGSGKTTMIEQVAARLNWQFLRLNMDSDITRDMLIGKDELVVSEDGVTVSKFLEGLLPKMIGGPVMGCLDEFDFGRSDIMYALQSPLEGKGLRILEDGGRIVMPHAMSRLFATGNTVGQGDEKGMYQGARQQSLALLDRFERWMRVDYLEASDRMKLIEKAAPALEKGLQESVGKYVTEHLRAFTDATVLQPITPRGYMDLAELINVYVTYWPKAQRGKAIEEAVATSVLDRATQQDRAVLAGIAQRVFGY